MRAVSKTVSDVDQEKKKKEERELKPYKHEVTNVHKTGKDVGRRAPEERVAVVSPHSSHLETDPERA